MRPVDWPDYFSALGQEFCGVLDPVGDADLVPHDVADGVLTALGKANATPTALAGLSQTGRADLALRLATYTGLPVTTPMIDTAIDRVLARWPAGEQG